MHGILVNCCNDVPIIWQGRLRHFLRQADYDIFYNTLVPVMYVVPPEELFLIGQPSSHHH